MPKQGEADWPISLSLARIRMRIDASTTRLDHQLELRHHDRSWKQELCLTLCDAFREDHGLLLPWIVRLSACPAHHGRPRWLKLVEGVGRRET
jgi:hypothetical protein